MRALVDHDFRSTHVTDAAKDQECVAGLTSATIQFATALGHDVGDFANPGTLESSIRN